MTETPQKDSKGDSGVKESFWDSHYRAHRYEEPDGTKVSIIDQVLIEANLKEQRFEPGSKSSKRQKRNLPI